MAEPKDRQLSELVHLSVTDGVAVIALNNPPFNAFTAPTRQAMADALAAAVADDSISEIAIIGRGPGFCQAVSLPELETAIEDPSLSQLATQIEDCPKPVVAALHGTALWGALDIALACHYRIAKRGTRVGSPEVRLGMVPFGGATQRMPRLIGAAASLDIMVGAQSHLVEKSPAQGMFDALFSSDDVKEEAVQFCRKLREDGAGPRKTADMTRGFVDAAGYQDVILARRDKYSLLPEEAPSAILECVEAAQLLPISAGLSLEEQHLSDLRAGDQSQALRRAYVAERKADQLARPRTDTPLPQFTTLGVLGGGPLAAHLVISALRAGMKVRWGTKNADALKRGFAQVEGFYRQAIKAHRIPEDRVKAELENITLGEAEDMANGAEVILHAARGQSGVPAPEGIVRIKAFPDQVTGIGMRFMSPAHLHRLVEIILGPEASEDEHLAAYALVRRLNKSPILVQSQGSSVVARMSAALHRIADVLIDLGQSPYDIDRALTGWGMRIAPFATRDGRGLEEFATAPRAEGGKNWSGYLVQNGRKGRLEGGGFYRVDDKGSLAPDKAVIELLDATRLPKKPMAQDDIVQTVIAALANEVLRMVDAGTVSHPMIADVAMIQSQGFPRWRGGPTAAADLIGLLKLKRQLEALDHPDGSFLTPSPYWDELIKNGRKFNDLN